MAVVAWGLALSAVGVVGDLGGGLRVAHVADVHGGVLRVDGDGDRRADGVVAFGGLGLHELVFAPVEAGELERAVLPCLVEFAVVGDGGRWPPSG